jgi:hypothetical protein
MLVKQVAVKPLYQFVVQNVHVSWSKVVKEQLGVDMIPKNFELLMNLLILTDIPPLLKILGHEYRIVVYDESGELLFNSPFAKHIIFLQLKDNHYDYIPVLSSKRMSKIMFSMYESRTFYSMST